MREVYETNVFGVIMVTNAMLPLLRRAPPHADRANVSSEVGSITSTTNPARGCGQMPASLGLCNIQEHPQHDHRDVREGTEGHPGQGRRRRTRGTPPRTYNRHGGFVRSPRAKRPACGLATLGPGGPSGILWGHLWTADGPADAYGPLSW